MDRYELIKRIEKKEDIHTEFKRTINREDLAKAITCFANTDGGQIVIGVEDSGKIAGVEDTDSLMRKVDDISFNRCEPPVTVIQETVDVDEKTVVIINVPKGDQRPYRTGSGLYYIHSSNRCRQASRQELLRLFQASESLYFDETEVFRTSVSDLDQDSFNKFFRDFLNMKITTENIHIYMKNLKVISSGDKPTLSGILFFGNQPQVFFPTNKVIAAYIKGNDISIPPTDKKEIKGKIPEILENTLQFLRLHLREEHIIKGMESELYPEIPIEALREALVNAVAHRDYTISAPIRIFIFTNRVEFHTPGNLPNSVTIESMKIGGSHVLRNPTLYNFLAKMGLVTDIGSGVKRIITLVRETVEKDVELELQGNEFLLTIPRRGMDEI
ncbi:MAG: putative DNA binding domain-containing protein [Methanosarcinales archaeon]|nr:putative DNA binding domain-containing protein [Methanosarcinales archaeon]